MGSLLLGIRVIFPLIVYMGLGYLFKTVKFASERTFRELNRMSFRCFLPVMVFYNICQSELREDFDTGVFITSVIVVFCAFGLALLFARKSGFPRENQSVVAQGIYRSNFVLFGMEVTRTICGEGRMGMASILTAVIVPIFNVLAVVLFEAYGGERRNKKRLALNILKNPLIIASALGLIVKALRISFAPVIETTLSGISALATPLALICLGGTFAFSQMAHYKKELFAVCLGRLVVIPLIFLTVFILLGVRDSNLVAVMVMLASPTAVSSYPMACEMGGNRELAGMIVALTSVLSVVSIFLWVFSLSSLGLI